MPLTKAPASQPSGSGGFLWRYNRRDEDHWSIHRCRPSNLPRTTNVRRYAYFGGGCPGAGRIRAGLEIDCRGMARCHFPGRDRRSRSIIQQSHPGSFRPVRRYTGCGASPRLILLDENILEAQRSPMEADSQSASRSSNWNIKACKIVKIVSILPGPDWRRRLPAMRASIAKPYLRHPLARCLVVPALERPTRSRRLIGRRFLRQSRTSDARVKRMGKSTRSETAGIVSWTIRADRETQIPWRR